jgi:hypothetical protein
VRIYAKWCEVRAWLAVAASQVADLTASTQGHHWRASHTQSGRCRM